MESNQSHQECIKICNSLLRGELSAIETYGQAIEKLESEKKVSILERIRAEHVEARDDLRSNIHKMGGEPSDESGVWGSFAKLVEGSATLLGEDAALKALEQGEKIGTEQYEGALESDDVMIECKDLIKTKLLPRQKSHLPSLMALQ